MAFAFGLILAMATGCSEAEPPEDYDTLVREALARNYSFDAHIQWEDMEAEAFVDKIGSEHIKVDFLAPEIWEGLSVNLEGEEATIFYRGMEMQIGEYEIPAQSILPTLWELLSGETALGMTAEVGEEVVTAKGSFYFAAFEMDFCRDGMEIQSIRIPDLNAVVEVENFSFHQE